MITEIPEHKCNCPICRTARGELKADEIGWYLKGCIEMQRRYIDLIKRATALDDLKKDIYLDEAELDENHVMLQNIKNNEKLNPAKWWDPAMDNPENFSRRS